jgi:hypothetical protein
VNGQLVSGGVAVSALVPEQDSLEDVFVALVEGADGGLVQRADGELVERTDGGPVGRAENGDA